MAKRYNHLLKLFSERYASVRFSSPHREFHMLLACRQVPSLRQRAKCGDP